MKKLYPFLVVFLIGFVGNAQTITFLDADLKAALLLSAPDMPIAKDLSGNFFKIDNNNDGEIQNSEALQVSYIDLSVFPLIEDMDGIENFTNLLTLNASNNVNTLNLYGLINLQMLDCTNNALTTLDLSGLVNLTDLNCSWGSIATLNTNGLTTLKNIDCRANPLVSLDFSSLLNLETLVCPDNQLTSLNISGLTQLHDLNCSNNELTSLNLNGLSNLQNLDLGNNQFSSIDLSGLSSLVNLVCYQNQISTLDLSGITTLTAIDCSNNQLTSLDVTTLNNLIALYCSNNQLTSLDVSNATQLESLYCRNNQLTTLNIAGLPNLNYLNCENNQIPTLDLAASTNLQHFLGSDNMLTSLDVSNSTSLLFLYCDNNYLTTLNIKNGTNEDFSISGNPNIEYICADEGSETEFIQYYINNFLLNCHVNSYCSFTPGGTFYTVQGNCHYDTNNNGCDNGDIYYPNLKLSFSDGTNTGNLIADNTGAYHYDVQTSTQTFSPILENPSYFTATPATTTITFPTTASPFIQDFCITANGVHNDLEVNVFPIGPARPGFDAFYKIIYKNKGTATQSGTISLGFTDSVMDLVSSNPIVSSQGTDTLSWDFSNLQPFETREISITLNLNSPVETPAVNAGNELLFSTTAVGATDETPDDNLSNLMQTVVNSFDPNDKTCIEGTSLPLNFVGEYVHYIIRFENTGTFAAENIVVKDIINMSMFDITTLVPLNGSHSFVTRVINTNQVEFIFENINLPFDDANNDGYVAFKIKTKPTLVDLDTFSNSASIYFDYNTPIITDTYTTTVYNPLNTNDFNFNSAFSLSPIPTKNILTISTKKTVDIYSISIYNTLGQLVQVNANPNETIDVSGLKTGSYFIKILSDKGTASSKFIKE